MRPSAQALRGSRPWSLKNARWAAFALTRAAFPPKSLLYSAKIYDYCNHGDKYGVTTTGAAIDQKKVVARKNKVVSALVGGIGMKMKKNGVKVVDAEGTILGRSDEGFQLQANGETYTGKQLLIATGSMPVIPPFPVCGRGSRVASS